MANRGVPFMVSPCAVRLSHSLHPPGHPLTAAVPGDTIKGTPSDLVLGKLFCWELQNELCVGRMLSCTANTALSSV
jgi:hypothetical protein